MKTDNDEKQQKPRIFELWDEIINGDNKKVKKENEE